METRKGLILLLVLSLAGLSRGALAQAILGKWQLVNQTTCLDDNDVFAEADSTEILIEEMKSLSGASAQIVEFKKKGSGEQSSRVLNKRRHADGRNFLYRFSEQKLLILDKKSQTISEIYTVDKFNADSLILSNNERPCDTKVFLKIKDSN